MFGDEDTAEGREERLDRVVVEYLRARSSGAAVDRAAFLRLHPELAPDLEHFFADEDEVERLAAPFRALAQSISSAVPRHGTAPRWPGNLPLPASWGPYELLEEVGRGGMGVVYRARHARLGRVVAIKVLAPGAAGRGRFEIEARAAARLQHPNVVQIFEVDEHEGHPYLVLEYVGGGSLAQRLKGSPLPAAEAARLVETLAGAVEEAHRRGVIHRDLKPANILLTSPPSGAGTPAGHAFETPPASGSGVSGPRAGLPAAKIADFGLAKQLDDEGSQTETGAVLGTPSYMAPEQAEGRKDIGPAADIYALGSILYELLTGRPPFRGVTRLDTLRQVVRDEPVPPSRLQPGVPRDLETVCLKCLEKVPGRRYPSAGALAEDVGRFLAGKPVRARRTGMAGRAWRWCRRQPVLAGLAAALTLALTVGVPVIVWQWARAEQHYRVAERLRAEAVGHVAEVEESFRVAHEVVHDLTSRVAESRALKAPGLEKVRKDLLEKARTYYLRFLERHGHDPALRLELAETYTHLASVTQAIASQEEALGLYRQAGALLEEMYRAEPDSLATRERLANLGIDLGALLERLGRHAEAIETLGRSRELLDDLVSQHPDDADLRSKLARVHNNLGIALDASGRFDAALRALETARDIHARLADANPKSGMLLAQLASGHNNVGNFLSKHGRPAEALQHLRKAASAREDLARRYPKELSARSGWSESLYNLGDCLRGLGQFSESHDALRQSKKVLEELVSASPDVTLYRSQLARVHLNIGLTHLAGGEPKEALSEFEESRNRFRQLAQKNPAVPEYRSEHARLCAFAASACLKLRRLDMALKIYYEGRDVEAGLIKDFPDDPDYTSRLATTCHKTAAVLGDMRRPDEARTALGEAIDRQREALAKAPGEDRYRRALAGHYAFLARLERDTGRFEESARAADERIKLSPGDPQELYGSACDFARLAAKVPDRGYADRAVASLRQAVANGFRSRERAEKEPAFEGLRDREDFRKVLDEMVGTPATASAEAP